MKFYLRPVVKSVATVLSAMTLTVWSTHALAGGFQLFEQNAVNMGDFAAGGAAIANDASTSYFNSAGLVRITNPQVVISADGIFTKQQFSGTSTWTSSAAPGVPYSETGVAQGGTSNVVPALHFATPIYDRTYFGFSITTPFGLSTQYGDMSVLRYSATKTQVQEYDLSPALAYAINQNLSVGAGFDVLHVDATLISFAGAPILATPPTALDTKSENSADAWGYGWHAGVLYQFSQATRVGLAYQSMSSFHLAGKSNFSGPLAGGMISTNMLTANLTLPSTTTLSAYHDFNSQWAAEGSVYYTRWSKFNDVLVLHNVITSAGLVDATLPEHFQNTWRATAGAQYTVNNAWKVRAGVGYDQTPVQSAFRNVRLPDGNRIGVAIGAHFQASKALGFDAGWTHLFMQDTSVAIPVTVSTQTSTSVGSFNNSAELVGLQMTWNI